MKTNYLLLPFFQEINQTSFFKRQALNSFSDRTFRFYTSYNKLLPFICPISNDCTFSIIVKDSSGKLITTIKSTQIKHKVFKKGNQNYLVYFGETIPCLEIGECKEAYCLEIGGFFSEWFWVSDNLDSLTKFEVGNSTDFSQIPYSLGFKQIFYLDLNVGTPEVDTFTVSSRDNRGNVTTTYQKLTETFNIFILESPAFFKQFLSSLEVLDYLKITSKTYSFISEERQSKVKSKRNEMGFDFFDLELSVLSNEIQEIGVCSDNQFDITTCFVDVPTQDCEIQTIEKIEVDCNVESDILDVDIDCLPNTVPVIFYATVKYISNE